MPLTQSTLADGLKTMTPTGDESVAIQRMVDAYGDYASEATGAGIAITTAGVELGKAAMSPVLVGMSAPFAAIAKIPASIISFWGAVCTGFAVSFPGSVAATPPPHASLAAAFAALMPANVAARLNTDQAMDAVAAIMHTDATIGGTVTLPGTPPVVGPII